MADVDITSLSVEISAESQGAELNIDKLATATAEFTYNVPNWKLGVEYMYCNAWYGDEFNAKHKATSCHSVNNHRLVFTALFQF